jgi:predicted SprT family Zn-dependent metalloprotease
MEKLIRQKVEFYFRKILGYVPNYKVKLFSDSKKRWAGQATSDLSLLEFNLEYHRRDPNYFETEIIGHEVAHLIVPILFPNAKQHHGPEFRKIMKMMGLIGATYIPQHMAEPKISWSCGCEKPFTLSLALHEKVLKMKNPVCRKCHQKVTPPK